MGMIWGFILASIVIELTPGPNMAYLALVSVSEGKKYGFLVTAGVALGLLIIGIISALGVGVIISESNFLYQCLRIGGVLYLLWLAYENWRPETKSIDTSHKSTLFFRNGLITNLLNPKAAIFYVAMLPQFINPDGFILFQTLLLTFLFVLIATIIHLLIVLLSSPLEPILSAPERRQKTRRFFAILLLIIAIWFAFGTAQAESSELKMSPSHHYQSIKAKIINSEPSYFTIDVKFLSNWGADENAPFFAIYVSPSLPKYCADFSDLNLPYKRPQKYYRQFDLSKHPEVIEAINTQHCIIVKNP